MRSEGLSAPRDEKCAQERRDQHDILDSRERSDERTREEGELAATRRSLQAQDTRIERGQCERVGNRVGECPSRESPVGNHDGEQRACERVRRAERKSAGEQIHRNRRERDEDRVLDLDEVIGGGRGRQGPQRGGEQRLEQRRKVGGSSTNQRAS